MVQGKNRNALKRQTRAFSLIEALIAIAFFIIIVVPLYLSYAKILEVLQKNKTKFYALSIIQNQIETIRNMPYTSVGVEGGFPSGPIPPIQTIPYLGNTFSVQTAVRNADDPSDGVLPQDTAPADYKLIEITVSCTSCDNFAPISIATTNAPKALESASNTGSLFVNVFDANGYPVNLANVQVINNALVPPISITDTTGLNGMLQLVGIPTSTASYEIRVSRPGYSSEQTYSFGAPGNPNPVKPNVTVAQDQLTQVSFAIDRVSAINLTTTDHMCSPIPDIPFSMSGAKVIGTNPTVLKTFLNSGTGPAGTKTLTNIEWDNYSFTASSSMYDVGGYSPLLPLVVNPSITYSLRWLMDQKNSKALLVTVQNASGTLVNDASVELVASGFNQTLLTGERTVTETDWSNANYADKNGDVDSETLPGTLQLTNQNGNYPTSTDNWLISKTFDFGTQSTTFYTLSWNPQNQPPAAGQNSLAFQIAANNDNATWNFTGPDGSANSYYTASGATLHPIHNNNRYLRYKVYMQTAHTNFTPKLDDIGISFSSDCIPGGQVLFSGLATSTYTLTIQKTGYQIFSDTSVSVNDDWQKYAAVLEP